MPDIGARNNPCRCMDLFWRMRCGCNDHDSRPLPARCNVAANLTTVPRRTQKAFTHRLCHKTCISPIVEVSRIRREETKCEPPRLGIFFCDRRVRRWLQCTETWKTTCLNCDIYKVRIPSHKPHCVKRKFVSEGSLKAIQFGHWIGRLT